MRLPLLRLCHLACALVLVDCATTRVFAGPAAVSADQAGFSARIDALTGKLSAPEIAAILARAEAIAAGPLYVRAKSLEHMAASAAGTIEERVADTRNKADGIRASRPNEAEQFALACSDMNASRIMLEELPLLATALRLAPTDAVREHLRRQLEEVVRWTPFQRPGWTLGSRKNKLPAGGDGIWLSTGTLLHALAITLEVLPPDALPADVLAAVRQRMAEEVNLTVADWKAAKPWFVKLDASGSNQWIVPASGMVVGAASLGRDRFSEAYELGVNSLRKSLSVASDDGSLNEGYAYATGWSGFSLLLAKHFMSAAGDDSFGRMPFFQNFPAWVAMKFQPGGNSVNSFDCFGSQRGNFSVDELTNLAAVAGDPRLARLIHGELGGRFRSNFFGLLAYGKLARAENAPDLEPLPAAGLFQRSHMFIWRQSWEPDVSGLWVRGGDVHDMHNHQDRGHVNFIVSGKPILIEAGTPGYANKRKRPDYDSTFGHNVLTLNGESFPPAGPAPITVARHDSEGGELSVDLRKVYPALSEADRRVAWTANTLRVVDTIGVADGGEKVSPDWRWHVASAEPAVIESVSPTRHRVRIPAGRIVFPAWIGDWRDPEYPAPTGEDVFESAAVDIEIVADAPVSVEAATHPDHTLKFRRTANPHTVLIVRPVDPVARLSVEISFEAGVPATNR